MPTNEESAGPASRRLPPRRLPLAPLGPSTQPASPSSAPASAASVAARAPAPSPAGSGRPARRPSGRPAPVPATSTKYTCWGGTNLGWLIIFVSDAQPSGWKEAWFRRLSEPAARGPPGGAGGDRPPRAQESKSVAWYKFTSGTNQI